MATPQQDTQQQQEMERWLAVLDPTVKAAFAADYQALEDQEEMLEAEVASYPDAPPESLNQEIQDVDDKQNELIEEAKTEAATEAEARAVLKVRQDKEKVWPQKMRTQADKLRNTSEPQSGKFQESEIPRYHVKLAAEGDTPLKDKSGKVLAMVSLESLKKADIEGTLRLSDGRVFNIDSSHGWTYALKEFMGGGKAVMKKKPDKFYPENSRWVEVTKTHPWGAGTQGRQLIPFRSLAGKKKYSGKTVLIKELVGKTMPDGETHNGICQVVDTGAMGETHFDWFIGAEENYTDKRTKLPVICNVKIFE